MSKFGPWRQTIYIIIHIPTVPHMAEPNFAKPCVFLELKSYHPANLATTLPQQGGITGSCHRWPIHPSLCERLRWPAAHQKGHPHGATKHHLVISGRGKNGRKSWMEEKELAFLWGVVVERYSCTISWEHDRCCKNGCTRTNTSRIEHVIQKRFVLNC